MQVTIYNHNNHNNLLTMQVTINNHNNLSTMQVTIYNHNNLAINCA